MLELRAELAPLLAADARYTIDAYVFVFEALEYAKARKRQARRAAARGARPAGEAATGSNLPPKRSHVSGRELCEGARLLLLGRYGAMSLCVAHSWGIRSTSDLGEIVYHLIRTGDLEATASDARSDFDDVFDLKRALVDEYQFEVDPLFT